jgi:16S rRNA (cytidine1402-2'-O)-methyltransferase
MIGLTGKWRGIGNISDFNGRMTNKPRPIRVRHMRTGPASERVQTNHERAAKHYNLQGQSIIAPPLAAGLHLVATPIGNLRDITLRALDALAAADLIACEDTRRSRKLLDHYGIKTPLAPYHEHNAETARPRLIARLQEGAAIALISDAGTPLISDPGFKLVRAAYAQGCAVTALPGPSAVLAALTLSGIASDRFLFAGFLPAKEARRRAYIASLKSTPATLILFETGPRIVATLTALFDAYGSRQAAICRELTKLHEEVRRGDIETLAREMAQHTNVRGEIVIVIAPPEEHEEVSMSDLDGLLRAAFARMSLMEAVAETVAATGAPRRLVYQRALALRLERGRG